MNKTKLTAKEKIDRKHKIKNMNKYNFSKVSLLLLFIVVTLSSCSAIAGIFKAGVWFGVIGVVVIVAIIFWLISKARK